MAGRRRPVRCESTDQTKRSPTPTCRPLKVVGSVPQRQCACRVVRAWVDRL